MTVTEAIEQLKAFPPDAEIVSISNNFELGRALVKVSGISLYTEGKKETEWFSDAFDGTSYSKEIYQPLGGDLPLVRFY